ncbi:hypothetical protein CDD80_5883 [Ophiocordyceps camponoti-rufipedis]|uniref:Uncharacterized protein n=1 Tax=Ophiocordyceps camponoti-rufipedis TaxID=2004952 RepID=A0A2C5XXN7_9HYPO|nr:hypothetical protein CDD80_5883 [Ophiocordyceps camponoti-rufipedis]
MMHFAAAAVLAMAASTLGSVESDIGVHLSTSMRLICGTKDNCEAATSPILKSWCLNTVDVCSGVDQYTLYSSKFKDTNWKGHKVITQAAKQYETIGQARFNTIREWNPEKHTPGIENRRCDISQDDKSTAIAIGKWKGDAESQEVVVDPSTTCRAAKAGDRIVLLCVPRYSNRLPECPFGFHPICENNMNPRLASSMLWEFNPRVGCVSDTPNGNGALGDEELFGPNTKTPEQKPQETPEQKQQDKELLQEMETEVEKRKAELVWGKGERWKQEERDILEERARQENRVRRKKLPKKEEEKKLEEIRQTAKEQAIEKYLEFLQWWNPYEYKQLEEVRQRVLNRWYRARGEANRKRTGN